MTVSSVELRTAYYCRLCSTLQSGLDSDTDCGCRRQAKPSLGFCFLNRTEFNTWRFGCSGIVFAVIGFCHRLRTATSRLPEPSTSETAADVQLSIARQSNLTKRKSSWRLKTHWDTRDCSATPSIEISSVTFFPKYLRQTPLDRHRLPTDAGFKSSLRPLSDPLALWKQNQHCDEKGVSSRKDFRWYEAFFARKRKRKLRKKCLARCGRLR